MFKVILSSSWSIFFKGEDEWEVVEENAGALRIIQILFKLIQTTWSV